MAARWPPNCNSAKRKFRQLYRETREDEREDEAAPHDKDVDARSTVSVYTVEGTSDNDVELTASLSCHYTPNNFYMVLAIYSGTSCDDRVRVTSKSCEIWNND
jgi:hypothetical protein